MTELLELLHALGTWSTMALWLPLLAWTALALPFYALIRHAERGHPLVRYRLLQALLFTLPAGLVAAAWVDVSSLLAGWTTQSPTPTGPVMMMLPAEVSTAVAPADSFGWRIFHSIGLCTAGAFLFGAVRLTRLVRSMRAVATLHADAPEQPSDAVRQTATHLARSLGVKRPVRVELTDEAVVPLTYGTRRPVILLPRTLTSDAEALRMTLTHELVHIHRFDYLARWAEQLVAAVFAVHPGLPRLTHAIEHAREIACDAEALRHLRGHRKAYADLLYGFSTQAPHPAFAVSIAETSSSLKERIRAMAQLDMANLKHPRYTPFAALVLLVGLGLGIVACSDVVTPPDVEESSGETATTQSEGAPDGDVFVVVEDRPELKGGMEALQKAIHYPTEAKDAGIEGRVFVQFIVDENGDAIDLEVTRGVHDLLDQAALEAVQQMTFEPGRVRGQAVKVKMALPVTFILDDNVPNEISMRDTAGLNKLLITAQSDETILVDGEPTPMNRLVDVLERKLAVAGPETYVTFKHHKNLSEETWNHVSSSIQAVGTSRISYRSK